MKRCVLTGMLAVAALAGCATSNPDVVRRYESQRMSRVQDATVLSVRPVTIDGSQSGAGSLAGGVVGGVAGSSIGGHRDSIVGGVLGFVVGSVIGNAVERSATQEQAVEVLVQLQNGERRAVVQGRGEQSFYVGDPVVLVTSGGRTHIARAPQAVPAGARAPLAEPVPIGVPMPVPPRS